PLKKKLPFLLLSFIHLQLTLSGDCPADGRTWVPFQDKCYHFVHGAEDQLKSYTYERARSLCLGFELLSIQSAEENDFAVNYSPDVWKGTVNVWLGMYFDTNSDSLRWSDDSAVKFTNWEDGFSPDLPPMETCAVLHSNTGKWEKVSCLDEVENGVVCEAKQGMPEAEKVKQKSSLVLSTLVILSVIAVVGVSAGIWCLYQRQNPGSNIFTAFEYHP
uniref:CD302 molecule n=1 Tax=Tetraodon nigroviridis TaxID=99883 RepID=H3DGF0_TETNG